MRKPSGREGGIFAAIALTAGLAANEALKPDLSTDSPSPTSEETVRSGKEGKGEKRHHDMTPQYTEESKTNDPLPMSKEDQDRMNEHLPLREKLQNDLIQRVDPKFLEIVQFGHVTASGSSPNDQRKVYDEGISVHIKTASGNVRPIGSFTPDDSNGRVTFDPNMELDQAIFLATGKHMATMDLAHDELDVLNTLIEELDPVLDLLDQQREAIHQHHPEDKNPNLNDDIRNVLEESILLTE